MSHRKNYTELYRNGGQRILKVTSDSEACIIQYKGTIFKLKIFGKYLLGDHWDTITYNDDSDVIFNTYDDAYNWIKRNNFSTFSLLTNLPEK
jgi:hypothetical protein